jgi:uncharacterized protein
MAQAQRARRAIVLSHFDVPDAQQLLLHGCEDCACPVSDVSADHAASELDGADLADPAPWIRGREVLEIPLDLEHQVLFNPMGRGGPVVVNQPAQRLFRRFQSPQILGAVHADGHAARTGTGRALQRLSQLELIHPVDQVQRPEFGRSQTLTAWLHVTNACNLRCPYCYVRKSAEGMDEATGRAAVEAVIRSATRQGFPAVKLKYAGGEASLNHRHMMGMHGHAKVLAEEAGLRLSATVLSNGVTLPATLVDSLKSEGIRVMISLDGIGARHDEQRPFASGRPSFHLVERTIAQLIRQGHAPHLSITITSRNASGLADVVRFALERDLTFSMNFFRDNDQAASFPDLRYAEQAMISGLLEAFAVVEELLPRWSVLGSILDRGQLLEPRQRSCGVGQDYVVIDQRGRVAKCHMEIERTLGDVFRDDPLELIQLDEKTAQNPPVDEKTGCRDCTWRYWCTGGCAVATFRATGRYDIKSPNCNIYKAIYPAALKLEGRRLLKYAAAPRR